MSQCPAIFQSQTFPNASVDDQVEEAEYQTCRLVDSWRSSGLLSSIDLSASLSKGAILILHYTRQQFVPLSHFQVPL